MMHISLRSTLLLSILVVMVGLLASCVAMPLLDSASQPVTVVSAAPTETPTRAVATLAPTSTARVQPTATSKPSDTPSPRPTARATDTPPPTNTAASKPIAPSASTATIAPTPTQAPVMAAAVDPHLVVITEADIAQAIAEGAGAQQGVTIQNLKIRFTDDKMSITADKLGYGLINMQNLNLVGRLVALDGVLSLEVESLSPRGLAANFIPTMANQALANYGAEWYVEDVQILDGRLELRIR